jgi:ribA/ribD-fused uncharacterized protein
MDNNINLNKEVITNLAPEFDSDNCLRFWHYTDRNGILSNFFASNIDLDGKAWPTVEHYFQAKKYAGTDKEEKIRQLSTPEEVFKVGRLEET